MELWKQSLGQKVYLFGADEAPSIWSVTATYTISDGTTIGPVNANAAVGSPDSAWEVAVPYMENEGKFIVDWLFTLPGGSPIARREVYDVITPYLSMTQLRAILGPAATDQECRDVETVARKIIETHTGQKFGSILKSVEVAGTGSDALQLPERLYSLTGVSTISNALDPSYMRVIADGWFIKKHWAPSTPLIPTVTDNYFSSWDDGEFQRPGTVIDFGRGITQWNDDYPFIITGQWGYESVPVGIVEATKLLVNDYACSETLYRDRYLESLKSADFRLQFYSAAYAQTGNVKADQLLSPYIIKGGWAIL